ncbi:hypothetical protein FB567DRAFT_497743 [Paraphoma chrysanthemicola]|uniref:Uncharacterized protein n=1 Tax=Paraphoma chrysanthemicola TaxID=798071 RepID=A0A8K0R309_9PLEO|nr:hypothetical protein FB567DRAFT_497743 [Paraphoma chrysanthemicola]
MDDESSGVVSECSWPNAFGHDADYTAYIFGLLEFGHWSHVTRLLNHAVLQYQEVLRREEQRALFRSIEHFLATKTKSVSAEVLTQISSRQSQTTRHGSEGSVGLFEIPSVIAYSHKTNALGDFCAKHNFMNTEHAKSLGLDVNYASISTVTLGNGKRITTSGTVKTQFRFKDEPEMYTLLFHLIPGCVHDIILGKRFLKATKTFSSLRNHTRRVVRRVMTGIDSLNCLYLGTSAPVFKGLLNGQKQEALADSGCKALIIDEDFAISIGLTVNKDEKHRVRLRFADGSTAKTSGMSFGVRWQFGPKPTSQQHTLDFHIMRDAPAPVILSDEFLFDTHAFIDFDCYLTDDDDDDDEAYFLAIDIDPNYRQEGTDAHVEDLAELIRRGEEDDRIADLLVTEEAEARNAETQRRTAWDARRAQLMQQASRTTLSQQSSADTIPPGSKKKSHWRFKLKRRKP